MRLRHLAIVALCFFALTGLLLAQDTASITGTVHDKSGAAVPGASVTILNTATGVSRQATTNSDGEYLVSSLPIGTYNITASAKGFSQYEAKDVTLRVAQKARIDIPLDVQKLSTEVVVQGEGMTNVETQSSEIAGTVTSKELSQLQLNGRNFAQLVTLVPGVVNSTGQDEGAVGVNGNVQYNINGGRMEYNNWELDGGDNMDNGSNVTLNVYPSLDAIAEVRVLTSNYGAQYGRNASGTIEVETKSGTNAFHGDVYEYVRNDMFNARNYFDDPTKVAPPYKKNDFGYTIGGPIIKNKTFFFWSQEWRRDREPVTINSQVPSLANRQGDFSDVCAAGLDCPTAYASTGYQVPFNPNDPNVQALMNLIPLPNYTDPATGLAYFKASPAEPVNWREELIRVDHNLTDKVRLMFRYIHDSWDTTTPIVVPWNTQSVFPTINTNFKGPGVSAVARMSATLSPTTVNEFVASYTTDHISMTNIGPWQRPSSMTMTSLFPDNGGKIPGIDLRMTGAYSNSILGPEMVEDPSFIPWNNSNPTYTLRDNLMKNIGKHNLTFGAYFVAAEKNEFASNDIQGLAVFDSTSQNSTGNAFADLLMGNIASFSQASAQPKYYNRYKILEPYVQDDWRITDRLTLNLGLRVSMFGTYREIKQQAYNFEPSAYNPANAPQIDADGSITTQAGALVPGSGDPFDGMVQCGAQGVAPGCMKGHLFNPAPRVGFAYDLFGDGKTSIRGGYGIFYEHTNGNEANSEGLEGTAPLVVTPTQYNIQGYTNIGGSGLLFPLSTLSIPTKAIWPYMQQWHLDLEHELFRNTVLTVSYVGSKGTHLTLQRDINQIVPTPASQNPFQPGQTLDNTDACSSGMVNGAPITGQAAINLAVACGDNPDLYRTNFPGYGTITGLDMAANSTYNSLQSTVRRTVGALTMSLAYTWSHSIDDSSDRYDSNFLNSYDIAAYRASSNFDQRHVIEASWVYELPFFKNGNGFSRGVLGGWEYSGIGSYQTGTPFSVGNGYFGDNAGVGNNVGSGSFADLVGDPYSNIPASVPGQPPTLYNPDAFAEPTALTFGTSPRNLLRNPSWWNFDMAMYKNFKATERFNVQFRAEAFNVFNHTEWSGVDTSLGSPTFLQPNAAHRARTMQFALKLVF